MSCCFVIVPVVVGGWPLISAAIIAAGAAMGYKAVETVETSLENSLSGGYAPTTQTPQTRSVTLAMTNSQVVADTLMRGESFAMQRDGITATFKVDGRGACTVHVEGKGMSEAQLEAAGSELMDKVRQQFAYAKVMQELEERGFQVAAQEVEETGSIRIRVQRM